ncbi:phytanoyl-CoA dioxygenase family protein [Paenibacillus xylanexedens]|uniref:phytanoyl-CoA dioxygenase family protein n=1 Tax=Paenibacillus xylanexedens TaxID=528191 RepID=UPI003D00B080
MDINQHAREIEVNGFTIVRNVLTTEQISVLKKGVEEAFNEPRGKYPPIFRGTMFERGETFEHLIDIEPIVSIAEAVLGPYCHVQRMDAIKTWKNTGVDKWHIDMMDDEVFFPLPEDVQLDEKIKMPCFYINSLYYLTDCPDLSYGPTQIIPGSQRYGYSPNRKDNLPNEILDKAVTFSGSAGDVIMFNPMTWHRGTRNESDTDRIVQGVTYAKHFMGQYFFPHNEYQIPQHILDRANPRRKRLFGFYKEPR